MPSVPNNPGLVQRIQLADPEPETGTLNFPTVAIVETRGSHGPVRVTKPPRIPKPKKQPKPKVIKPKRIPAPPRPKGMHCSWCGGRSVLLIHMHCQEIKDRIAAERG